MTTDKTKLLKMIENAINRAPDDEEIMAKFVIDATADWFEEVLQTMGVTPSCIPTLLRWQAHQHEYLSDGFEVDTSLDDVFPDEIGTHYWQETGDGV